MWRGLGEVRDPGHPPGVVALWWALWLSSLLSNRLISAFSKSIDDRGDLDGLLVGYGITAVVEAAAAVTAVLLVRRLDARYRASLELDAHPG